MSIVVHIHYTGEDGAARRFAEEMEATGTAARIRRAPGNLGYDYYLPLADGETVLLVDRWADQEAIDRHHASPMMAAIAALREKYNLHMRVERFVDDADGVPEADRQFIRR